MIIQCNWHSEPGGHAENEDACEERIHPKDPGCGLYAIADGQCGTAGGAEAARLACKTSLDAASLLPRAQLKTHKAWTTILRTTDQAVTDNAAAGYTTLVCFCFVEYSIFGASVGDSDLVQLNSREPAKILT